MIKHRITNTPQIEDLLACMEDESRRKVNGEKGVPSGYTEAHRRTGKTHQALRLKMVNLRNVRREDRRSVNHRALDLHLIRKNNFRAIPAAASALTCDEDDSSDLESPKSISPGERVVRSPSPMDDPVDNPVEYPENSASATPEVGRAQNMDESMPLQIKPQAIGAVVETAIEASSEKNEKRAESAETLPTESSEEQPLNRPKPWSVIFGPSGTEYEYQNMVNVLVTRWGEEVWEAARASALLMSFTGHISGFDEMDMACERLSKYAAWT